jgi:hypothetical protein
MKKLEKEEHNISKNTATVLLQGLKIRWLFKLKKLRIQHKWLQTAGALTVKLKLLR